MPKSARESKKVASAPYKKGAQLSKDQPKKSVIAHKQMNKKGMKFRNEALTDQIDNLLTAASTKKPKSKTKPVDSQKVSNTLRALLYLISLC